MFEGYNGRRRLRSILAVILAFIILLALFYRIQKEEEQYDSVEALPTPSIQEKARLQRLSSIKKSSGVMSMIEFTNSPYLDFQSLPDDIIPIMVISNASNIEVRDAIRRTWGFYRSYRGNTLRIKTFFIVGIDDFMTQRIIMEQNVFDDVIQVSIPDLYTFIAYKELSAMIWVQNYLPKASCYIKTEDDVILNINLLVDQFLPIIESVLDQDIVVGWFGSEHSVERGTYQKFIDAVLPPSDIELHYAMSLLYAVTASAANRMINAIRNIELIEYPGDPFVTGILRDAAAVQITNIATLSNRLKYEIANEGCKTLFSQSTSLLLCTTSLHVGTIKTMSEYFEAWNVLIQEKDL